MGGRKGNGEESKWGLIGKDGAGGGAEKVKVMDGRKGREEGRENEGKHWGQKDTEGRKEGITVRR